jgi:hypothetical protein
MLAVIGKALLGLVLRLVKNNNGETLIQKEPFKFAGANAFKNHCVYYEIDFKVLLHF